MSTESEQYWARREARLQEMLAGPKPTTMAPSSPQVVFFEKREITPRAEELYRIGAECLNRIKDDPSQARNIVTASRNQLAAKVKQITQTATGNDKRDRLELADHVDAFLSVAHDFNGYDPILIGALANVERAAETL